MLQKIKHAQSVVQPLLGRKAWDARIGIGTFLLIEFGKAKTKYVKAQRWRSAYTCKVGEWGLWLYWCSWRIEHKGLILASSFSEQAEMESAVSKLNGRTIEEIAFVNLVWDSVWSFSGGYCIKTFVCGNNTEYWKLKTPNGKWIVVGPDAAYEYDR